MATMKRPITEPHFAGDIGGVDGLASDMGIPILELVLNGHKQPWHAPQYTEQSVDEAEEARNRLLTVEERQAQEDAARAARMGHNRPPSEIDDPLADMTPWQIYQRCIWISDEDTNTRISLLALSRYMPKDLRRGCSMSYRQLASDCGFSLATAKRVAKSAVDINRDVTWLRVSVGKGRYVPGKGSENLYFGIVPQKWADELRRRKREGIAVEPDGEIAEMANEVSSPEPQTEVSQGHPEGGAGYQADTEVSGRHPENPGAGDHGDTEVSERHHRGVTQTPLLQNTPEKKKEGGAAHRNCTSAEVDAAHAAYNEAARMHGFEHCSVLTISRRKRLLARLADIGGLAAFKRALSAIPQDNFLMGRVAPKPGQASFKLNINRLMQTEGGLGDVLANLLDRADSSAPSTQCSLDDEVRKFAGSDIGKALISELGADAGMKRLREIIIDNQRRSRL
jgi:hypothetical protein